VGEQFGINLSISFDFGENNPSNTRVSYFCIANSTRIQRRSWLNLWHIASSLVHNEKLVPFRGRGLTLELIRENGMGPFMYHCHRMAVPDVSSEMGLSQ
jgi:hypothetical protein